MAAPGKRSPNFSLLEVNLLIDLVSEVNLAILQQEGNDVAANERKSRLWQSFAARLNAVHGHDCPWTAIR